MRILLAIPLVTVALTLSGCRGDQPEATHAKESAEASGKPVYGSTNPAPGQADADGVMRFGSAIGLNPEKEAYYRKLHAEVWPGVLTAIQKANIRNYSIFFLEQDGQRYLFSYFEYVGDDFKGDMARIGEDPITQKWWRETDPCQRRLPGTPEGEQWLGLERVFFFDEQE